MVERKLLDNLNRLGFPLMEVSEDFDVNQILADVVSSREIRLWEGFPVMLANAAEDYRFDYNESVGCLADRQQREYFHGLVLLSLALFQHHRLSFSWSNRFRADLSEQDSSRLKKYRDALLHNAALSVGDKRFSGQRLKEIFSNYFKMDAEKSKQLKEKHEELSLEYALSQVFSPKQKELFKKKLKGEPLDKTEKEYYSRTVKKKVVALANPELNRLAQRLMNY